LLNFQLIRWLVIRCASHRVWRDLYCVVSWKLFNASLWSLLNVICCCLFYVFCAWKSEKNKNSPPLSFATFFVSLILGFQIHTAILFLFLSTTALTTLFTTMLMWNARDLCPVWLSFDVFRGSCIFRCFSRNFCGFCVYNDNSCMQTYTTGCDSVDYLDCSWRFSLISCKTWRKREKMVFCTAFFFQVFWVRSSVPALTKQYLLLINAWVSNAHHIHHWHPT